jgi:hypothetical protein
MVFLESRGGMIFDRYCFTIGQYFYYLQSIGDEAGASNCICTVSSSSWYRGLHDSVVLRRYASPIHD